MILKMKLSKLNLRRDRLENRMAAVASRNAATSLRPAGRRFEVGEGENSLPRDALQRRPCASFLSSLLRGGLGLLKATSHDAIDDDALSPPRSCHCRAPSLSVDE
jgi:hypothetical protein